MNQRLFLSYARPDREVVDAVADDLRASDCDPFFDELLGGGEAWWDRLLSEMERCDAFVPVLSHEYLRSRPCDLESRYAHELGKPFLPLMIQDIPSNLLPAHLAETQWIAYSPSDRGAVFALHRGLTRLPTCPPLPEPMPPRPPIPINYLEQLKQQLESPTELARAEQVLLLADLRERLGAEDDRAVRFLLELFANRAETTAAIAAEIRLLLAQPGQATPPQGSDPPPPPPPPPPPAPDPLSDASKAVASPATGYWAVLGTASGWFKLVFACLVVSAGICLVVGLQYAGQVGEYNNEINEYVTWGDVAAGIVMAAILLVVAFLLLRWKVSRSRRRVQSR